MQRSAGVFLVGLVVTAVLAGGCGHESFVPGRACAAGERRACYSGPQGTEGVGACTAGEQTCKDDESAWGPCQGEVVPRAETCMTPEDDDCDGQANEEGEGCACLPGAEEPCYTGPAGTEGVGLCAAGVRACEPSGTWGPCIDEVRPVEEDCANLLDEDCDGAACAGPLWARRFGDAAAQDVGGIAADGEGNTFVAGGFQGTIELGDEVLTSAGSIDVFVAKLDAKGQKVWAVGFGESGAERATSIAVDAVGDVVIAGSFSSATLGFGDGGVLANDGGIDAFAAKLDGETGEVLWAIGIGDAGNQEASGVAVDAAGNAYVAGWFTGTLECPVFPPKCLQSQGQTDAFVGRIGAAGGVAWLLPFGGAATDLLYGVAADPDGNAIVAGTFADTVDWGGKQLATSGAGDHNLVVAKLAPGGTVTWAKGFGDVKEQYAYGVAADTQGNVAVTGVTYGPLYFDGLPTIGDGGQRAFAALLAPDGQPIWSRAFGTGMGVASGRAIAFDAPGNLAVAGTFGGTIAFGKEEKEASGLSDAFLAKLDAKASAKGAPFWAKAFGAAGFANEGRAVAFTPAGDVLFAAAVRGTIDFGLGQLPAAGDTDVGAAAFSP